MFWGWECGWGKVNGRGVQGGRQGMVARRDLLSRLVNGGLGVLD